MERKEEWGEMAATLTLLTEISISVMGVGTWERRKTSPAALFSASSRLWVETIFFPGQCTPWQLRPDSLSYVRKVLSPWLASKAWLQAQTSGVSSHSPVPQQ